MVSVKSKIKKVLCLLLCGVLFTACTPGAPDGSSDVSSEEPEPVIHAQEHLVAGDGAYLITSPDKTLRMTVAAGDQLCYTLDQVTDTGTTQWIRPSLMGATLGNVNYSKGVTVTSATVDYIKEDRALMGNQSTLKCRCIEVKFELSKDDHPFSMEVRVYNNGVAFRYLFPEGCTSARLSENTTYALRSDVSELWYSIYDGGLGSRDYETLPTGHTPDEATDRPVYPPLLAIVGDNQGYLSVMEGGINESYPGTTLSVKGDVTFGTSFMSAARFEKDVPMTTAWRLINLASDLDGIVNNYNIYTVCEAPDEAIYGDTSWIQPGRSTWSWVAEGVGIPWPGQPTVEKMERYTNVAAKLGFEYNIIDDGWPTWAEYRAGLSSLGVLGKQNNVKQVLWGAVTSGTQGFNKMQTKEEADAFLALLKETGMSGAKIDFWWDESDTNTTALQQYILQEAAKNQLVIDFHGCNKNSGFNITYPNELSREGIHGGEYFQMPTDRKEEYATLITSQLFTRYLCGHADWTPAIDSAMEIGSMICIDSPLMVIASKPEDILNSPAVELIKSIPSTWDRTYVLSDSRVGQYAVYAKEKEGVWFVGGVASEAVDNAKVTLSEFLPQGSYTAQVWYDENGSMKNKTLTVTKDDVIDIGDLAAGQGFALRLTKLSLSQYGGEIKGDITVTAPEGATVTYTTDGTDPRTSETALDCKGTITLSASCRLTVAITKGDGKGTLLSYQFNKLS